MKFSAALVVLALPAIPIWAYAVPTLLSESESVECATYDQAGATVFTQAARESRYYSERLAHPDLCTDSFSGPGSEELSPLEKAAICTYISIGGYRPLNQALRAQPSQSPIPDFPYPNLLKAVCHSLQRQPKFTGEVFRGAKLSSEVRNLYRQGEVVLEKSFISTTHSLQVATEFLMPHHKDDGFMEPVLYRIRSVSGRELFGREREVLLPAGTLFEIQRIYTDSSYTLVPTSVTVIEMNEIIP